MASPALNGELHPDGVPNERTGTILTASLHIFCAIVGAGVLALPNALTWLGWIAGPILIFVFYVLSLFTAFLLADIYQVDGLEFPRYHTAVQYILGKWYGFLLSIAQVLNLVLITVAYTVSAGTAMKRIAQLACEYQGKSLDDCWDYTWKMTLIFGACQVPLSMVPDLEALWWVSAMGVLTSLAYATIALGLGLHYSPNHLGTIGGRSASPASKTFGVFNALGAIAFAYIFHVILLEIQDTLRQPPKASKRMKPAMTISLSLSFFYYFTIAVAGYSALGNDAPSYIFLGFPEAPRWLMIIGNLCILIHMLAAYQVFAQPVFESVESHVKAFLWRRELAAGSKGGLEGGAGDDKVDSPDSPKAPAPATAPGVPELHRRSSASVQLARLSRASAMYRVSTGLANTHVPDNHTRPLPIYVRFIVRTAYVIAITVVGCCLPFFSDIAGLIGALTFWPLAIFFPIRMWRKVYRPHGWFNGLLWTIEITLLIVSIVATSGSIRGIIQSSKDYTVFAE